jgi:hypothetical protein
MSKRLIIALICHRHKLLDPIVLSWLVYVLLEAAYFTGLRLHIILLNDIYYYR